MSVSVSVCVRAIPHIGGLCQYLLPQVTSTAALQSVEVAVHLIGTVECHVYRGVLVDVAENEVVLHDKFFRLEACVRIVVILC